MSKLFTQDMSITHLMGSGAIGVASTLWQPVGSCSLPCGCLAVAAIGTTQCHVPPWGIHGPLGSCLQPWDWIGDQILGHCATTCYVSSSTHPCRLGRFLRLSMHEIPFLLPVCLAHIECATDIEWKFLPTWLVTAGGRDKMNRRYWWGRVSLLCL